MEVAESISTQRASSLGTRFRNEDALLEKAQQRVLFGWGGYGRSRIYDAKGRDITLQDGLWIIIMGQGGWFRYLAEFGLLTAPIILLMWRRREYDIGMETSILAIILAGNLLDLLPNATSTPLTWMFVGALWGRLEMRKIEESQASETGATETPHREPSRSRDEPPEKRGERYRRERAGAAPETSASESRQGVYTRQHNKIYRRKYPNE